MSFFRLFRNLWPTTTEIVSSVSSPIESLSLRTYKLQIQKKNNCSQSDCRVCGFGQIRRNTGLLIFFFTFTRFTLYKVFSEAFHDDNISILFIGIARNWYCFRSLFCKLRLSLPVGRPGQTRKAFSDWSYMHFVACAQGRPRSFVLTVKTYFRGKQKSVTSALCDQFRGILATS